MRRLALLLGFCALAAAQTKVDLGRQGQNVDFSSAVSTKPFKTGVDLPSTCSTGQTFFKTNAPAGLNLYACTSTDVWTLQGDGGGASGAVQASDLLDCKVLVSGAVATVKAPCSISIGGAVFGIITDATATLSGSSASGTVYFYWDSSGRLVADENTVAALACNANCATATTGGVPYSSLPVATATFTTNSFDGGGVTDSRAWLNQKIIVAGAGITANVDGGSGVQTISTDPLEVPRFYTGTSNPSIQSCTAGRDFYANTVLNKQWGCTATNTWTELTGGGGIAPSTRGAWASRPTCDSSITGQVYYVADGVGVKSQCNGTAWADFFGDVPIALPGAASGFTVVNGGTLTDSVGTLTYSDNNSSLGVALKALPDSGASWTVTLAMLAHLGGEGGANYPECGLWVSTGTVAGTSNAHGIVVGLGASTQSLLRRKYYPISGSIEDDGAGANHYAWLSPLRYFRVSRSGSNLTYYTGDGVTWNQVGGTTSPIGTVTHYGFGCDARGPITATMRVFSLTVQ